MAEIAFAAKHAHRSKLGFVFLLCPLAERADCFHCKSLPSHLDLSMTDLLRNSFGSKLPPLVWRPEADGSKAKHYKSLSELLFETNIVLSAECIPGTTDLVRCCPDCKWNFLTNIDEQRHYEYVHSGVIP